MITRDELRDELVRFPTREELRQELARFATREELYRNVATREELYRDFATRQDLAVLREETAAGFADLRRYMEVLYEDLKGTMRTVLDTIIGRMDRRDAELTELLGNHERRLTNVEGRVTSLEHNPS